jgi:hypothetical protein
VDTPVDAGAAAEEEARLSAHLEAHRGFDETHLAAALNAMSRVVSENDLPDATPEAFGSRDRQTSPPTE